MPKDVASHPTDAIVDLLRQATTACDTAKTAARNRVSLEGDNFYGNKFHGHVVNLRAMSATVTRQMLAGGLSSSSASELSKFVDAICSSAATPKARNDALRALRLLIETKIKPVLDVERANSVPNTEHVLPMSVVQGTRSYFEKVVTQANGCYEHQWYDACSVMIRRFVETLIVELYEAKKLSANIKDSNGDFLMLQRLIDAALNEPAWNLSRETKKTLPLIKKLGDRAAHNRRYVATKQDVDDITPGLRVVVDDLLHLAGIK